MLKKKVLAVSKLLRFYKLLRAENESIVQLKQLTPNHKVAHLHMLCVCVCVCMSGMMKHIATPRSVLIKLKTTLFILTLVYLSCFFLSHFSPLTLTLCVCVCVCMCVCTCVCVKMPMGLLTKGAGAIQLSRTVLNASSCSG
jgi:hypothetical protein